MCVEVEDTLEGKKNRFLYLKRNTYKWNFFNFLNFLETL